jgi:hypothetical protein
MGRERRCLRPRGGVFQFSPAVSSFGLGVSVARCVGARLILFQFALGWDCCGLQGISAGKPKFRILSLNIPFLVLYYNQVVVYPNIVVPALPRNNS